MAQQKRPETSSDQTSQDDVPNKSKEGAQPFSENNAQEQPFDSSPTDADDPTAQQRNVWLFFAQKNQRGARWLEETRAGQYLSWRHGSDAYTKIMQPGDTAVVLIAGEGGGADGTIEAIGIVASVRQPFFLDIQQRVQRIPFMILSRFENGIPWSEVRAKLRVDHRWRQGAVHPLSGDTVLAIDRTLRQRNLPGIPIPPSEAARLQSLPQMWSYIKSNEEYIAAFDKYVTAPKRKLVALEQAAPMRGSEALRALLLDAQVNWVLSGGRLENADYRADAPARKDSLQRRFVANSLAWLAWEAYKRKEAEPEHQKDLHDDQAFIVHLHGAWGSGKSSIFNFFEMLLNDKESFYKRHQIPRTTDWTIVNYNAWKNQKSGPAWWTLLEETYRQAVSQLRNSDHDRVISAGLFRFRGRASRLLRHHLWWRLRSGWLPMLGVIGLILAAIVFMFTFQVSEKNALLDVIVKYVLPIVTVLGGVFFFRPGVGLINTKKAEEYMALRRNPLTPLSKHFHDVVRDIDGPVAILIDDLDRCDAAFVVELLHTIQTLYRGARVFYVVAADRTWIKVAFETSYGPFKKSISDDGHSLGYKFLEKVFQASISVPNLRDEQVAGFWEEMLRREGTGESQPNDQPIKSTDDLHRFADTLNDAVARGEIEEVEKIVFEARGDEQRMELVGDLVLPHVRSSEIRAETKHRLLQSSNYLSPNPRAIKRALNTYNLRREFEFQTGYLSDEQMLFRAIVFQQRWPDLAEWMKKEDGFEASGLKYEKMLSSPEVRKVLGTYSSEEISNLFD